MMEYQVDDYFQRGAAIQAMLLLDPPYHITVVEGAKPKTDAQRNALHLWFRQLATVLNDAGLDQRKYMESLKDGFDIPWNEHSIKESLYKPIMEALTGHSSTEEQTTVEPDLIIRHIVKLLGERYGVVCPPLPDRHGPQEVK